MASKKQFLIDNGIDVPLGRGRLSRELQAKLKELGYVDDAAPVAKPRVTSKRSQEVTSAPVRAPEQKPIKVDVEGLYKHILAKIPGERYGEAVDSIVVEREGITVTRGPVKGAYISKFYPYK